MISNLTSTTELPAIGFLAGITPEHRAFLACFGKYHRLHSGDVLIAEGAAQDSLYVILSGTLHIVSSAGNRPLLLASLGEGQSIGEVNLFDTDRASATAIVRSNALIWSLSRSELNGLIEADPDTGLPLLRGLLRQLSQRIRSMNEKLSTARDRRDAVARWRSSRARSL
jgi:CRP-like cAMP-binding protein